MWLLYNLLFLVGFLLAAPFYWLKMVRRGNWREGFGQRLGIYNQDLRSRIGGGVDVWIQAVSVGEVGLALAVIQKLRALSPGLRVALTTTTSTGQAEARKRAPADVIVAYFPLDWRPLTRRAWKLFSPRLLVVTETEIWPNILRLAKRHNARIALVNGRISDRSFSSYARIGFLSRPVFGLLDLVLAQSAEEAQRFISLGVRPENIRALGQMKFDLVSGNTADGDTARSILARCGVKPGQRIWVCGSTFAGEEEIVFRAAQLLRHRFPDLFVVVVPRHAERAAEVMALAKTLQIKLAVRSRIETGPANAADALMVDTTGELLNFYATATVVFVGKSLTAQGGQNPIEPAALSKAIVVGPHTGNFREVIEAFRRAQAIREVENEEQLIATLEELLTDDQARTELGRRAQAVVAANRGTLEQTASALRDLLKPGEAAL